MNVTSGTLARRGNGTEVCPGKVPFEYSAPQYCDFSHNEDEEEVRLMESYFNIGLTSYTSPDRRDSYASSEELRGGDLKQMNASRGSSCSGYQTTFQAWGAQSGGASEEGEDLYPQIQGKRLYEDLMAVAPKATQLSVTRNPNLATARRRRANKQLSAETPPSSSDVQATKRHKRDSAHNYQLSKGMPLIACSTAPLTIPQEFHFETEERMRSHPSHRKAEESHPGDCGTPLLEAVRKFQTKTPARFHTVPPDQNHPVLPEKVEFQLTMPHEPHLETSARVRPIKVKSAAEMEEEEMANMPKFKARPFDKQIVENGGNIGVRKVQPPPPTKPQDFHFLTAERALLHPQPVVPEKQTATLEWETSDWGLTVVKPFHLETAERARPTKLKSTAELEEEELASMPKFKAKPLNKKILESSGDLGVPRIVARPVTTPEGFHLLVDERAMRHKTSPQPAQTKVAAVVPAAVNLRRGPTIPAPFSLETEERGMVKVAEFRRMLEEEEREQMLARERKARELALTIDHPQVLKKPPPKKNTIQEPFEGLENHHEKFHSDAEHRLNEIKAELDGACVLFRARPNHSRNAAPLPLPARKPLTEFKEFNLKTDSRAVQREEFDKLLEEKEAMRKRQKEQMEIEKQRHEERELKRLRREDLVHQARPMPIFDNPFQTKRSSKKPIVPVSPRITWGSKGKENHDNKMAEETARQQLSEYWW